MPEKVSIPLIKAMTKERGSSNYKGVPDPIVWDVGSYCQKEDGKLELIRDTLRSIENQKRKAYVVIGPDSPQNVKTFVVDEKDFIEKAKDIYGFAVAVNSAIVSHLARGEVHNFGVRCERYAHPREALLDSFDPISCMAGVRLRRQSAGRLRRRVEKNDVVEFEPSIGLTNLFLKSVNEQHNEIDNRIEKYKQGLSKEELGQLDSFTAELPDSDFSSFELNTAKQKIKDAISNIFSTIARSQSILGESEYVITENGKLNNDMHFVLSDRLPIRLMDVSAFSDRLYNELKRAVSINKIGGEWGELCFEEGELVMRITLKNKVEKREWVKAETF